MTDQAISPWLVCAGPRPARATLASKPHRRTLLPVMPLGAHPRDPSLWPSRSLTERLKLTTLEQSSRPRHNCQRHYPHSARHHRANMARGFLP